MTEGISQEALEAARSALGQSAWDNVRQSHDSLSIVQVMQSLIDSTIERACQHMEAAIAYGYDQPEGTEQCEHGKFRWDDCIACYDEALLSAISEARQIKGTTNV